MGINWDIVNEQAKRKAQEYATSHPNHTIENAYFQGYIQVAAELESLRIINARLHKEREVGMSPPTAMSNASLASFM